MSKKKESGIVISQREIADGIFDLWINTDISKTAKAGQFVGVYPANGAMLLPRPISICKVDKDNNALRLVYRVAGKGTLEFSFLKKGDRIDVLGPLGNGYPVDKACGKKVILMGGGIGVPPLLEMSRVLKDLDDNKKPSEVSIVMGYRNSQDFLADEFRENGQFYVATDDGSLGVRGTVIDALNKENIEGDVIFACGPMPMLRAIKKYAGEHNMEAYISLEEKMACGVGACLGCVVKTRDVDAHSHVKNARICTDGPVYDARDVEI
ncbi:dihydroorotate dehydrogenase electron transfer subunit [Butyrivibrio sp. NC3005]|uniref:dihydroorotate dehydrogenase electron transfer subunit n=1 Tax=Butyrivibrio sp. NC3005 TaxID=1280685 RepID=UPI000424A961|nr:dihydroorotate dehydrogenase electron transfer subunit [Butyrivibrio sp. NC3005]